MPNNLLPKQFNVKNVGPQEEILAPGVGPTSQNLLSSRRALEWNTVFKSSHLSVHVAWQRSCPRGVTVWNVTVGIAFELVSPKERHRFTQGGIFFFSLKKLEINQIFSCFAISGEDADYKLYYFLTLDYDNLLKMSKSDNNNQCLIFKVFFS